MIKKYDLVDKIGSMFLLLVILGGSMVVIMVTLKLMFRTTWDLFFLKSISNIKMLKYFLIMIGNFILFFGANNAVKWFFDSPFIDYPNYLLGKKVLTKLVKGKEITLSFLEWIMLTFVITMLVLLAYSLIMFWKYSTGLVI